MAREDTIVEDFFAEDCLGLDVGRRGVPVGACVYACKRTATALHANRTGCESSRAAARARRFAGGIGLWRTGADADGACRSGRLDSSAHAGALDRGGGKNAAEVEAGVHDALNGEGILVDPVVTVTVAEYNSRPISVAGSVHRPLTFQAVGQTSLLEALTRAEGLTEDAGQEILITRRGANASDHPLIERVQVQSLIQRSDPAANLILEGGEEIRVPPAGRVFVVGNVKKPGAFRVEEATGMTVLKALAMAEGLTPFSTKIAYVYRPAEAGAKSTPPRETPVELRKIMDRQAPDVPLEANDIFYVPDNRASRNRATALERILTFVAGTSSGVLIYGVSR